MTVKPSQEQFDAMNDAQFSDWWDAYVEARQAESTSVEEDEAAEEERNDAYNARWN